MLPLPLLLDLTDEVVLYSRLSERRRHVCTDVTTEASFKPTDAKSFNHGSALKISVITGFICQQLDSKCKAPAASVIACKAGATAAAALTGQAAADAFNAAVAGGAAVPAGAAGAAGKQANAGTDAAIGMLPMSFSQKTPLLTNPPPSAGKLGLDFGKCTDPTIKFGGGFDGRPATELTFLPTNSDGLFGGQQSALNPNIIANFICNNLVNRCIAGQDALDACAVAKAAVAALNVRDATVVTAFNSALGF